MSDYLPLMYIFIKKKGGGVLLTVYSLPALNLNPSCFMSHNTYFLGVFCFLMQSIHTVVIPIVISYALSVIDQFFSLVYFVF